MKIAIIVPDNRDEFRRYADPAPHFGMAPTALLEGLGRLPEECEIHVVNCVQRPVAVPAKIGPNIFYHTEIVPKWGWLRGGYLGCVRSVRRQLAKIRPDIVHGQGTERFCAFSAVLSGFPNIVTVHGNMNAIAQLHQSRFGSYQWFAARFEDFTLPRTAGIICISDYVKNLVGKYQVETWIVPNAIQGMFFDFPRTHAPSAGRPLLINVGVVSERKRQQQLLAVLETLREEGMGFDTLFVGTSSPHGYARDFAAALAQANRKHGGFEHINYLDEASFCQLYDRASAMIHFSNEESFGLTFAEAIARGLYLFASDVGAIRDIARGVEQVQIFGVDQWGEMKNAVRRWLAAEEYKQARPARPPTEFWQRYDPVSVARRHLEIYREVLRRPL
jgi:glycosyltransferase involved in cell wall biosynthesis